MPDSQPFIVMECAVDREAALRLIADAGACVDAAVRRRPLFSGAPFTLPAHEEDPG